MEPHVIEHVTFKLKEGTAREAFLRAAAQANAFITSQPGFVRRRLSRAGDGTWSEHIEWESMEAAQAAAKAIGGSERTRAFLDAIDGPSVALFHSELEIAVN